MRETRVRSRGRSCPRRARVRRRTTRRRPFRCSWFAERASPTETPAMRRRARGANPAEKESVENDDADEGEQVEDAGRGEPQQGRKDRTFEQKLVAGARSGRSGFGGGWRS